LWWVLAAIVIALAVGIPLLLRARRRSAWHEEFAAAELEVVWFARTLIPDLRRLSSSAEVVGGWNVAQSRVVAAEDRLTGLEPTAPDEESRQRVTTLRDAVRVARDQMSRAPTPEQLDAVAAGLEQALWPPPPPPGPPPLD
jgi:hypothetical protein